MRVGVNLKAVKLERVDLWELRRETVLAEEVVHFLFEFEKLLERDIEEVAGTAGGVEHADGFEAFQKREDQFLRRGAGFLGRLVGDDVRRLWNL